MKKILFSGCILKKRILLGLVVYLDFSLYLFISSYKYNVVMSWLQEARGHQWRQQNRTDAARQGWCMDLEESVWIQHNCGWI